MRAGKRLGVALLALSATVRAEVPSFTLEIRGHLFYPSELAIPADTKVRLIVINRDPTPEEFESYELNREKVIMGGAQAVIFLGPLPAGTYPFFGEFILDCLNGTEKAMTQEHAFRAAELCLQAQAMARRIE